MNQAVRQGDTIGVSQLSLDQAEAYSAIVEWARDRRRTQPVKSLGGYAGSGKTVLTGLVGSLPDLQPIAFCAYTGKASSVLRGKLSALKPRSKPYSEGCPYRPTSYCGTIHSLIYQPIIHGNVVVGFELREELDAPYRLICIDEASMVNDDMLLELRGFGIPILAVGDHGQLPPVSGQGSLMYKPDIRLEKIHRQAEGNKIIALSKTVRETGRFDRRLVSPEVQFVHRGKLDDWLHDRYVPPSHLAMTPVHLEKQVILVHSNASRIGFNQRVRTLLGIKGPPQVGDQVVCLRNVRDVPVYNGMRGIITKLAGRDPKFPWQLKATVAFEGVGEPFQASMCIQQFNREKTFNDLEDVEEALSPTGKIKLYGWDQVGHLFDFGYALTTHKSQGSQWPDVMVIADRGYMGEAEWRRWAYTAITRASEKVIIVE